MKTTKEIDLGCPIESSDMIPDEVSDTLCEIEPRMDGGRGAWLYLAAAVSLETITWGYATSFGVLLDFYSDKELSNIAENPGSSTILALVGTVNTGIMAFLAPLLSWIIARYPSCRRLLMISGLAICFISLFSSSYATSCMHVLWSQGIGYGLGGSTLYFPALSYLTDWFSARLGLANGLVFAGTGLGGLIFPLIINTLLGHFGVKLTLQILACVMTFLMATCVTLIGPRISRAPETEIEKVETETTKGCEGKESRTVLKEIGLHLRWPIVIYLVSNTFQAVGFFLPGLYLPSYAHSLSLKSSEGTATVAAFNASSIVARVVGGILSDHYSPHLMGSVTSLLGGGSVLMIWGIIGNRGWAPLMVFATAFGSTSGVWTSLYFGVARVWLRTPQYIMPTYGIMSLTRGVGNIAAGPISSALISITKPVKEIKTGFDVDSYAGVIWLSGLSLIGTCSLELILWILQKYYKTDKK